MNIPSGFQYGKIPFPIDIPKIIVVVGSSGVGKTTAVDSLRNTSNPILFDSNGRDFPTNGRGVVVPKRYITRAARIGQSTDENINITRAGFLKLLELSQIFFPWKRDLGGDMAEFYGFQSLDSVDASVENEWRLMKSLDQDWPSTPIYSGNQQSVIVLSGNNAVGKKVKGIIDSTVRRDTLVIGISLSGGEREKRIRMRNPEMFQVSPKEMNLRLSDPSDTVEMHSHLVLENNGTIEQLQTRLALLIREFLEVGSSKESKRGRFHREFYPPNIGFSE